MTDLSPAAPPREPVTITTSMPMNNNQTDLDVTIALVQQWTDEIYEGPGAVVNSYDISLAKLAAQYGADQELEACCEWIPKATPWDAEQLRAARRPKLNEITDRTAAALAQPEPEGAITEPRGCPTPGACSCPTAPFAPPELIRALELAEAALADIGDAEREPGDDLAWAETRAARDLPRIRAVLARWGK